MDCSTVEEQLSEYILGSVDPGEFEAMHTDIGGCGRCRERLREEGEITAGLAYGAKQVEPLSQVKHRLMSRIERDAARPQGLGGLTLRFGTYSGMAAASMVVLLLVFGGAWANSRLNEVADRKEALGSRVWTIAETPVVSAGRLSPSYSAGTPGLTVAELSATRRSDSARGMLLAPRSGDSALVAAFGLPALPAGLVYRVWLVTSERWYGAGSFTVDSAGQGYVNLSLPAPMAEIDSITVTIERVDGSGGVDSDAPDTGRVVLRGDF
jgi:hypothetical protein